MNGGGQTGTGTDSLDGDRWIQTDKFVVSEVVGVIIYLGLGQVRMFCPSTHTSRSRSIKT